jgi:hypothetical protein
VTFIENYFDPDPADTTYEGTLVFLIRENNKLRIEHDHHILGIFTLDEWRDTIKQAGFSINEELYNDKRRSYPTFIGIK